MKAASQNNLRFVFSDAPPVMLYSFIEQTLQPGPAVSLKCSAGIVFYLRSNFFPFLNFLLFCIFFFRQPEIRHRKYHGLWMGFHYHRMAGMCKKIHLQKMKMKHEKKYITTDALKLNDFL